jgi:hypothetical protein
MYEAVKGFSDKCRKIVEYKGSLLIAGNNGLYVMKYGQVERLIPDMLMIFMSLNSDQAFCATRNGIYRISKSASIGTFFITPDYRCIYWLNCP